MLVVALQPFSAMKTICNILLLVAVIFLAASVVARYFDFYLFGATDTRSLNMIGMVALIVSVLLRPKVDAEKSVDSQSEIET